MDWLGIVALLIFLTFAVGVVLLFASYFLRGRRAVQVRWIAFVLRFGAMRAMWIFGGFFFLLGMSDFWRLLGLPLLAYGIWTIVHFAPSVGRAYRDMELRQPRA